MDVSQIALFGLAAVILAMILKQVKGEWGFFISFAAAVLIAIYLIGYMEQVFGVIRQWNQYLSGISDYMLILSKALGITYICEFTTGICKDAGYITIGNQIELCGKIAVLMLGMPILLALLQTIEGGFLG